MSTIGYESWAVDMADVGPIYPFQGSEMLMVIIGVAFWIVWHRIQFVREKAHLDQAEQRALDHERVQASVERY
jgi:ABC-type nickel/cobalt efflux system permease component RcnA